jgi:hypothetical protein
VTSLLEGRLVPRGSRWRFVPSGWVCPAPMPDVASVTGIPHPPTMAVARQSVRTADGFPLPGDGSAESIARGSLVDGQSAYVGPLVPAPAFNYGCSPGLSVAASNRSPHPRDPLNDGSDVGTSGTGSNRSADVSAGQRATRFVSRGINGGATLNKYAQSFARSLDEHSVDFSSTFAQTMARERNRHCDLSRRASP